MIYFWFKGPQRDFDRVEGILETVVGYSGSKDPTAKENMNPTYKDIKDCKLRHIKQGD